MQTPGLPANAQSTSNTTAPPQRSDANHKKDKTEHFVQDVKISSQAPQKKSDSKSDETEETDKKTTGQAGVASDIPTGAASSTAPVTQVSRSADIQEIISQMVDELSTLTTNDSTETMLTLTKPPAFKGAQIVISEFKSAKGEFNVSFNNLGKDALALIGQRINGDALRQGLDQKGFTLHIIQFSEQSFTQMSQGDNFGQGSGGQSEGGSGGESGEGSGRDSNREQNDASETQQEWQEF